MANKPGNSNRSADKEWQVGNSAAGLESQDLQAIQSKDANILSGAEESILSDAGQIETPPVETPTNSATSGLPADYEESAELDAADDEDAENGFTPGPSGGRGPASVLDAIIPDAGAADELPMGAQQLKALKEGGLSPTKIAAWRKDAEKALSDEGLPEEEIRAFFGDPSFDPAPMKEYLATSTDWHAPMANAPSYSGKPAPKVSKEAKGHWEAFTSGFQGSSVGLAIHGGLPDKELPANASLTEQLAHGAGTIAGDALPMAGAAAATLAALPAAGAAGLAGAAALGASYFMGGAAPAGMRKILMDYYEKGGVKSFQEFADRFQETLATMGEGGLLNAATLGAGKGAGKLAGKVTEKAASETLKAMAKTGSALGAEVLTMGAAPKAIQGEMPEPEDFAHAAALVVGMHAVTAGVMKTTEAGLARRAEATEVRVADKVDAKLKATYAETGLTPAEVTEMARRDPILAQELVLDKEGVPDSLKVEKPATTEIVEKIPEELGGGEHTTQLESPADRASGSIPDEASIRKEHGIPDSDPILYQGVRAKAVSGEIPPSDWWTTSRGRALEYANKDGPGGHVRVSGKGDFAESMFQDEYGNPLDFKLQENFGAGQPKRSTKYMSAEPPSTEGTVKPELPPAETASKEASPREAFKNATPEQQAKISNEAAFNFVKSGIGEAPVDGVVSKSKKFLTEGGLREHLINKYDPLTQFVREMTGAKSQEGAINAAKPSESPVLLTGLFNGVVGKAIRAIESDTISFKDGSSTGEGLIPILKVVEQSKIRKIKNKIPGLKDSKYRPTVEDFDAYLFAKHAEEVATKYDHITGLEKNAAATKRVIQIGDGVYKDAAKRFVDFQNRGLKYLADSGMKSPEEYAAMTSKYEHYIVLEKIIVGDAPGSISKSLKPKEILKKRGKGSAEQIHSPTMRAAERVHEYYTMAEKNRIAKTVYDMIVENDYPVKEVKPDPGFKMEIMDENGKPTGEFATVYRELKSTEHAFFEDGVRRVFDVPENVSRALKAMSEDPVNLPVKIASIPAQLLRMGVTLPVDFMLKNMFRDQFHAFTQSRGKYIPYASYLEGVAHKAFKTKTFREYQSSGAMNSSGISVDIDYSGQNLARIADKTGMRDMAYNVVKSPLKAAQVMLEFGRHLADLGEVPTRIGEFATVRRKLLKQGMEPMDASLKAGFAARNVTLDFQRMGASMKTFNMIVPFLNPNIQGMAQIGTNIQERRYDVALKTTALTAAAAGLWALNKDDPRMKEIPQWQKDMFYLFPMDEWVPSIKDEIGNPNTRQLEDGTYQTNIGKIIRVPKPQGMISGAAQSIEAYLDYLHSQDPDAGEVLRTQILKAFLPNTPINPTAFSVPMQLQANYDTFRDTQIVPWYLENSRLPHNQFKKSTSPAAKFLSEKLFELGADTDIIPSPAKTEFAVTGLLGSSGKTGLDVIGYALDKMAGRPSELSEREWDDLPFVRSFAIRMPETSEAVSSYYNLKKEHEMWLKDTKAAVKAEDDGWLLKNQGRKEYLVMGEMQKPFAQAAGLMKAIKEQIEQVEGMPESKMSKAEKTRVIDAYMWTRVKIARELIQKNKTVESNVDEYWKAIRK